MAKGRCPAWGLPLTTSEDERLLFCSVEPLPRRDGLIAIQARQVGVADALADACSAAGYATVCLWPGENARVAGPLAVVWDGDHVGDLETAEIQRLASQFHPAPVIALVQCPRAEDVQRARAAGATAVVSKPFLLDDLHWQLDRVLGAVT